MDRDEWQGALPPCDPPAKLLQEGEGVVCESPKVRKRIYELLTERGLEWEAEMIGTTGDRKPLNPWIAGPRKGIGYSPGRIFRWLEQERLDQEELMKAYQHYAGWGWYSQPGREVSEADVRELFDARARRDPVRKEHVYETLRRLMPTDKYGPFDSVGITKTIKRIRPSGGRGGQKDLETAAQVAPAAPQA